MVEVSATREGDHVQGWAITRPTHPVTGGGTGLGKGMAEKFLQLGAEIFICGLGGFPKRWLAAL